MGGRTLPTECEHGVTVDWGDFGPCQDCADHDWSEDCPNIESCPDCDQIYARQSAVRDAEDNVLSAAEAWADAVVFATFPPAHALLNAIGELRSARFAAGLREDTDQ